MNWHASTKLVVVALMVLMASCRRPGDTTAQRALEAARQHMQAQDYEAAEQVLERAMGRRACRPDRGLILRELLLVHLQAERPGAAFARFKEVARENPALAGSVVGTIEQFYWDRWQYKRVAYWCRQEVALPLPEDALATVADWHLRALLSAKLAGEIPEAFGLYLERVTSEERLMWVTGRVRDLLTKEQQYEALMALVDVMEKARNRSAEWAGHAAGLRVDALAATARWQEAGAALLERAGALPDKALADVLGRLTDKALGAGQLAAVDEWCEKILREHPQMAAAREAAAYAWVRAAIMSGRSAPVVERLETLRTLGLPADVMAEAIDRAYAGILTENEPALWERVLTLCNAVRPLVTSETRHGRLAEITLDFCFVLERLREALEVLEAGVPGRDRIWHDTLSSKIKAHLALKQGRNRDAVEHFREFMRMVQQRYEDQFDPSRGVRISREMVLGFNAKRIGDILTQLGDKAGAREAYAEARKYYEQALAAAAPGSAEARQIQSERDAVPADDGGTGE